MEGIGKSPRRTGLVKCLTPHKQRGHDPPHPSTQGRDEVGLRLTFSSKERILVTVKVWTSLSRSDTR